MSIRLGSKLLPTVYLGSKRIPRVYLGDKIVSAIIVPVPAPAATLTYNGAIQTMTFSNYNAAAMTKTASTGTNAGAYSTTFTLKPGYMWSDYSLEPKVVNWSIGKAAGSVTIGKGDHTLSALSEKFSTSGTGALTLTKNSTVYADATLSDEVITVTSVKNGGGITITVTAAESANYLSASKSITVTINVPFSFSYTGTYKFVNDSYKEISQPDINASGNWNLLLLSSGKLNLGGLSASTLSVDLFVGGSGGRGGGSASQKCDPNGYFGGGGGGAGGGYSVRQDAIQITGNTAYDITVGICSGSGQASTAFGLSANPGGNGGGAWAGIYDGGGGAGGIGYCNGGSGASAGGGSYPGSNGGSSTLHPFDYSAYPVYGSGGGGAGFWRGGDVNISGGSGGKDSGVANFGGGGAGGGGNGQAGIVIIRNHR